MINYEKNPDADVLNTPRGHVVLATGEWRPGRDSDDGRSTKADPSDDPSGCTRWLRFLEEITGGNDDDASLIGRFMGYSLSGHTAEHVALCLRSGQPSSKSALLRTWGFIMGDYALSNLGYSTASLLGRGHPSLFELAELAHKRLVLFDADLGEWPAAKAETLVGGEKIEARFQYGDKFLFTPEHKIVAADNMPPTNGALRRRRHVRFVECRPPLMDDPSLEIALRAEAPSILRWMIDQHLQWREHGLAQASART